MTRVLIVDDKEENLYYLNTLLTAHGCTVESARHGAEALVKARQNPPELVIADLLMPVMDGYTLLRHWKVTPQLKHIPFIVYTATYIDDADKKLAIDLGADAFILKPAEPDDFLARVREVQANTAAVAPTSANRPSGDETVMLEVYSQTLIRKLEEKSLQLEETNAALRNDIVARKLAEEKLRHNESMLAMASRLGRLGAWIIALPSQQMTWSDEVRAIHEVNAEFVPTIEKAIGFYSPECRPVLTDAYEACLQDGTPFELELQIISAAGRPISVRTMGEAVRNASGEIMGVQGAIQDITERKLLEDQFRQAQKMEAIGTLSSGIAHDFNNIIGVIQGNVHLAISDLDAGHPSWKSVHEIKKAAHHARNLVQQILTFSRQQPQVRRLIYLGQAIEETFSLLRASLPANIELSYTVADGTSKVHADITQLHQVLLNLCTNALHAIGNQAGSIRITVEEVTLHESQTGVLGTLSPGQYVHLSVSDTGKGMDEPTLERIFNPFFTTKSPGEGTGLGLSVVDGIIRDHEGKITVTSQPGEGTTFNIFLPASIDQIEEPMTGDSPQIQQGLGQHILYLDDNEALVELATRIFDWLGYRVTGFTSAEECIKAFTDTPDEFDLLITDFNMPRLSGLDVAARLLAVRPGFMVILISGYIDDGLIERAHAVGIRHVVDKTVSIEDMAETIHGLLAQSGDNAGPYGK